MCPKLPKFQNKNATMLRCPSIPKCLKKNATIIRYPRPLMSLSKNVTLLKFQTATKLQLKHAHTLKGGMEAAIAPTLMDPAM